MKTTLLVLVAAIATGLFFSFPAKGVPGDEHWDAQFGAPGMTNNFIYAAAVNGGTLYAAGVKVSGSRTNSSLYVWDGRQWGVAAVFGGINNFQVNDLAFVGNTLYAAGNFTNVNGVVANGLARWDGTTWSGIGFSGTAYALAVNGNNLYVGGMFTNLDNNGVTMTNIGYWDGSAWHALGGGLGVASSPFGVRAMAVNNGLVYAGGLFFNSGSQTLTNLAVWNGSAWSSVGGNVNSIIYTLAFNGSDLYVGGSFTLAGSTAVSGIAKWDGATWSALNGGLTGGSATAESLAVFNGSVCVAGAFGFAGGIASTNFATWNGSAWSAGGGLSSAASRVVANGTNVYVGGSFAIAGNVWVNDIATWDGTHWGVLGSPGRMNGIQSSVMALGSDGTNLYAGGFFSYAGRTNAGFIARFDGTNWQSLGPGLNNQVDAIAVTNNQVYAGGLFTGTLTGQPLSYIGLWDGTNWNSLGSAGGLVYALAIGTNGVYAAGTYYTGTQYGSPYFTRWTGASWQSVIAFTNNTFFAVPLSDSVGYDAIAIQGTNVYLGGNITGFTQFDPNVLPWTYTNCGSIVRFDGTWGWIMGTGLNNTVVALADLGTNVFAAGSFTTAGGVPANQIAVWNGNTWSSVGGSVIGTGTVLALTTIGNTLYAGGTFTNLGGVAANRIASWNGTSWSALGSGASGVVQSLAAFGSDVYAGGSMRYGGDKPAYDIARWNGQKNFDTPQISPLTAGNGQFRMRLSGIGGLTNIIQATTNFSVWMPVLTNTVGIYDFTDSNSTHFPFRFYRAILGP